MTEKKISQLTQANAINSEDRVLLNQNGETKTAPFSALSSKLNLFPILLQINYIYSVIQ